MGSNPLRRGLGMDGVRDDPSQKRERENLIPPTREEIARTIFVGNIPEGVGDEGMERILAAAGTLRRWTRATDAANKPQTFGFAEYEDAESLETAAEIFQDVRVPTKRPTVKKPEDGAETKDEAENVKEENEEEDEEKKSTKLQVMVDDASIKYADEWKIKRGDDEATTQFRIDSAKQTLTQVIQSLWNPSQFHPTDAAGDSIMQGVQMQNVDGVEVVQIPLNAEDELADIPPEMRETVAAEIASFRERSIRRDQERLRIEEEIEAEQRRRDGRRSPVPASAPTGPGGAGVNGVPLGPRADRGILGAPVGPRGGQFPRDYQGNVSFVNGGAVNNGVYVKQEEDEDSSASDSELENRRLQKRDAEREEAYKKALNQWQKSESRVAAHRGKATDRSQEDKTTKARKDAEHFESLDEESSKQHKYYTDSSRYMDNRKKERDREIKADLRDRDEEERERQAKNRSEGASRKDKDVGTDKASDYGHKVVNVAQPFKLSLGAAAKKIEKAPEPRRTAAEVENLLEDEELGEASTTKKRTLVPINFDASVRASLTAEEVEDHQRQLAKDIPSDKEGLWNWDVAWDHLTDSNIEHDLRNWAKTKILALLGMQEDLLIDYIVNHLKKRGKPGDLVKELEIVSLAQHISFSLALTHFAGT